MTLEDYLLSKQNQWIQQNFANEKFLGIPYNVSFYTLLTQLIAHECGVEVGEFIHSILGACPEIQLKSSLGKKQVITSYM